MTNSQFGRGTGPQLLGYLNCQGDEHHLLQCPMSYTLNSHHWNSHSDDAGVICPACTYHRDLYHRLFFIALVKFTHIFICAFVQGIIDVFPDLIQNENGLRF